MAAKRKQSDVAVSAPDLGSLTAKGVEGLGGDAFFQSVLDGIQDGIKIVDGRYRIVYANRASEERAGKSVAEMVGKTCHGEFYGSDTPCAACRTARTFKSGRAEVSNTTVTAADGDLSYVELTSFPIKDVSGSVRYVIEITKDVTARKRLEQQLLHSERLASMGTLASSIAHEINNPLSVVVGFAQDLLTEMPPDDPRTSSLRIVEQEALRCGRVLHRLLHFTRAHKTQFSSVELGRVLTGAVALVRPQAKKSKIQTRLKVPDDLPAVTGDVHELEQVFVNLALNAVQAMPEGGTLTFAAERRNGHVHITVADTGAGIEPADLDRVFEPFFSKKGLGGTGLGLAICRRIISDHQGTIRLESEPGTGTRVFVTLPVPSEAFTE